jgi:pimeloyl-ACP methyl ester carboxylesterase
LSPPTACACPPVVLAHGAGGHHAIWWQQIPHLRERYTLIALDFSGFGHSDSPEVYDAHQYAGTIVSVLDDARIEPPRWSASRPARRRRSPLPFAILCASPGSCCRT